jgi:hypothetical protein
MVHHATSARNEVGRAFLPILPPAALQSFEQRSKDFPFLIFHNFSFLIISHLSSLASQSWRPNDNA